MNDNYLKFASGTMEWFRRFVGRVLFGSEIKLFGSLSGLMLCAGVLLPLPCIAVGFLAWLLLGIFHTS